MPRALYPDGSRASLNVTVSVPAITSNVADTYLGGMVSRMVMVWSTADAMGLFCVSYTAPASMSIWGASMALTVAVQLGFRSNVI